MKSKGSMRLRRNHSKWRMSVGGGQGGTVLLATLVALIVGLILFQGLTGAIQNNLKLASRYQQHDDLEDVRTYLRLAVACRPPPTGTSKVCQQGARVGLDDWNGKMLIAASGNGTTHGAYALRAFCHDEKGVYRVEWLKDQGSWRNLFPSDPGLQLSCKPKTSSPKN